MDKDKLVMEINSPSEVVRIGEISLGSIELRADKLVKIIEKLLKNKDVLDYLKSTEEKKIKGNYYG